MGMDSFAIQLTSGIALKNAISVVTKPSYKNGTACIAFL